MTSILASAERRCLIWIAKRLPDSITPDHLTALALVAMSAAGLSYWAARFNRYWLAGAIAGLAVNWFGDSLDGTLARVRRQERPRYGFYVDHIVDCGGALFLCSGLALSGFMNPLIALAVLVAYFLLSIEIYLATYCLAVFRISFWGLGPTELRILLSIGTLALLRDPTVDLFGHPVRLFDLGGVIAAALMAATAVVSAVRNARALYQAERRRPETSAVSDVEVSSGREQSTDGKSRPAVGWQQTRRCAVFSIVGAMGMALQLGVAWALATFGGVNYLTAIALSVEIAIVHNFFWHERWTWSDRPAQGWVVIWRFLQFNATTGMVSLAGNVIVTAGLVSLGGWPPVLGNLAAIGLCSAFNFLLAEYKIFGHRSTEAGGGAWRASSLQIRRRPRKRRAPLPAR